MIDKKLFFFLHIPRTSGTSARAWMHEAFGLESVFWHAAGVPGGKKFGRQLERGGFSRYRAIGGHVPFGQARRLDDPVVFGALVREPSARLLSHYVYISDKPHHPLYAASLEEAFQPDCQFYKQNYNQQCFYVGGSKNFEDAWCELHKHYFILGTFEQSDLFFERVAQVFDVSNPPRHKKNVSSEDGSYAVIPYGFEDEVNNIIEGDLELYERVRSAGVLDNLDGVEF